MSIMSFFNAEKRKTASVAKDRLQLIIAHERSRGSEPSYLPALRRELVEVISKYVKIDTDKILTNLEKDGTLEVLEVKIELPEHARA